jgi:hypothetical protein
MFAVLSIIAFATAGVMAAAGPPSTSDPVASASLDRSAVEYVVQSSGTSQPTL